MLTILNSLHFPTFVFMLKREQKQSLGY